ncbi:MAG: YegS/Rv2252/BmrU family lipid kinase [Bacteroidales bacterium]|nr:YegS/Rv2252/BmrU family lipid kinase [Bacteroidales bacterium]
MKKVAFIINPASGLRRRHSLERKLEYFFRQQNGWETVFYHTTCHNDAYNAALRYKEVLFDMVVAIGGDGTVNQVACALVHSSVTMGIIPTGSGNGLARHLKIPISVPKAIDALLHGNVAIIDSGMINGRSFFCTAGIGFDAHLAKRFNRALVRGFLTYITLSVLEFIRYRPQKYIIYAGEEVFEREAFLITFANAAQWGNNIYISPCANTSDGLLDLVVWKRASVMRIPFMAIRLLTKKINRSKYIENIRGASFRVERIGEGYVQYDGEHTIMGKELKIGIHPSSLRVVTPCSYQ